MVLVHDPRFRRNGTLNVPRMLLSYVLVNVPCYERSIDQKCRPFTTYEEQEGEESMGSIFGNDELWSKEWGKMSARVW